MKTYIFILILIPVIILLYAFTLKGISGNPHPTDFKNNLGQATSPFESSHERSTYDQILSIVERKSFQLTQEEADFGSPDIGIANGKFYSLFPPGVSVMITPL